MASLPSDYISDSLRPRLVPASSGQPRDVRWTTLLEAAPTALHPYALQLRYLLIDEWVFVQSVTLPANNLATLLFRLEHNNGLDDVQNLMQIVWNST